MVKILPFRGTGALVAETDEYIDKVSEAVMVLERAVLHYLDHGPDEELDARVEQIREIEARGDELRRGIANVMYTEMLMPDSRGDVLNLLDAVDGIMDASAHLLVHLSIERPELPAELLPGFRETEAEVSKAVQEVLLAARAYFVEPHAVRDHVHKIGFHESEATQIAMRTGRAIFDTELPLERKRQLLDWIVSIREIASLADDIGDQLAIFAVKRSI